MKCGEKKGIVSLLQEVLSAVRVVKAFAREDYEQRRLEKESREAIGIALRVRSLKAKLSPTVDLIVAAGTSLVLWFGGLMALRGVLSAGSLVLFTWYLGKMYKPMRELSKMTDAYSKAAVGYERIREVLEIEHRVKDLPGARPAPKLCGEIELDNVTFGYGRNTPAVLKDVSLVIQPGQLAALVGRSGAGKTSVMQSDSAFLRPGRPKGKDCRALDVKLFQQKYLHQQVSFVLQETVLFHRRVVQRAYGKPGASRDDIERAAKQANAHEFIERLPQGYDTLSWRARLDAFGGQRQRIAIARAVICDSPILIMDEVSSGLDAVSEQLIFDALNELMKGKTSIIIAHKLSTIRSADVIFVVEDGRVVERGKHKQLLNEGGLLCRVA